MNGTAVYVDYRYMHKKKPETDAKTRLSAYFSGLKKHQVATAELETASLKLTRQGLKDYVEAMPEGTVLQVSAEDA